MSVTQATLLGDTFGSAASGTIPVGGIIMWSGSTASIPTGWSLCDGANGTPNLQDRFIVGAGSAYGVGATGGENSVTLTTSQTPNHRHFLASTSGYQGSEGGKAELGQAPTQHISSSGSGGSGDTQEKRDYVLERATGECNVGLSGPPIDSSGNQSFGQAHENRPPYYALAFIMRVS